MHSSFLYNRRRVNRVIRETATRLELKEIIKELEEEIEELQTTTRGKDAVIENLNEDVSEYKREYQELEQKQANSSNYNGSMEELKKKLEEEKHRSKSLQCKLDKVSKEKSIDLNSIDKVDVLQAEKKELSIQIEDLQLELQKTKSRAEDLEAKMNLFTNNKDDITTVNAKLRDSLEKYEDEIEVLTRKLKTNEKMEKELGKKCEEAKRELERVSNHNLQLKKEVGNFWLFTFIFYFQEREFGVEGGSKQGSGCCCCFLTTHHH